MALQCVPDRQKGLWQKNAVNKTTKMASKNQTKTLLLGLEDFNLQEFRVRNMFKSFKMLWNSSRCPMLAAGKER